MNTKQTTEEKVFAYICRHHMLEPGERLAAGISGGADSVCLLLVLLEWAKRVPLELAVVHINHGIRPEAAEDAAYVEQLCQKYRLPFFLIEENVQQKAQTWKCSQEEAGRRVRYEAFTRTAQEWGAGKIAVAHNSNDRSETMLFHLFRGSGIKGLGSIQPVRDNIIRPILCLERAEIEAYLQEQGVSYCQDATNGTDDYTRNRIRHHILPFAEEEIVRGAVRHMAQTAEMLLETEDYLEQQTQAALAQCIQGDAALSFGQSAVPTEAYRISVGELLRLHPVIQKRVLHFLVKSLSPGQKDISYVHIQELSGLFHEEGNRMIHLPFGIRGRKEYDTVVIEKVQKDFNQQEPEEQTGGVYAIGEETGLPLQIAVLSKNEFICRKNGLIEEKASKKCQEVPQNEYTKWFDYDKIKGCLEIRHRRAGDYLTIADGSGGIIHKSVKEYMITQKIPRMERDRIWLLAEGSHVLWLFGYRISEYYKIGENTKYILQVQWNCKEILKGIKFQKGETEENNGRTC